MNVIALKGRLTTDPEVRQYGGGKMMVSFGLAVRRMYKKPDKPEADFFNCAYYGALSGLITRKGQEIAIAGRIENSDWVDRKGEKRRSYIVIVDDFDLCGPKTENGGSADSPRQEQARQEQPRQEQPAPPELQEDYLF